MALSEDLTCAQLVELVTDYVEGALSRAEETRVDDHLARCPGCSIHLDQLRQTIELTGRLRLEDVSEDAAATLLAAFRDWHAV
jgi:anti-sigma factor RsiW